MNPYQNFVSAHATLFKKGKSLSLKSAVPPRKPKLRADAPVALIFSPHPDDECIIGGLALRLLREGKMRVINVAVTLGSNPQRRPARWRELKRACDWLGFGLELAAPGGLEKINLATRAKNPKHWTAAVKIIVAILNSHQPRVIFFPHAADCHPAHVGTHWLVMDALKTLPKKFQCQLVETEFWGQMTSPNLLVESSVTDVADLVAALSLHTGEVRRNPYHLRLPAWMQDNVRRGSELVGVHGDHAPDFQFGTLYRLGQWKNQRTEELSSKLGKQISAGISPRDALGWRY